jgi:putative N6-adenine-specific DNA methylase
LAPDRASCVYHVTVPTVNGAGIWSCAATCTRGLEEVLAAELAGIGAAGGDVGRGVVRFVGDFGAVARANLWLRTAMRVLVELVEGGAPSRAALYDLAAQVAWEEWVGRGQTVAVSAAGQASAFPNTAFAALVVKDALVDRLRGRLGWRPDVDRSDPDLRVWVHLAGDRAAVGVDSTGEPLSHRGYRPRGGPAPLAESLAAGILLLAGYDGSRPLLDPMCGTGTIAIEAAMIATRSAPGRLRSFACERWSSHETTPFAMLRSEALEAVRPPAAAIVAGDVDPRALAATRANADAAGVGVALTVARTDARRLAPVAPGTLIVANPPYGQRLGGGEDLRGLYRAFGEALRGQARGSTAWLLVGDLQLLKDVPLRPSRRIVLFNGPIECRLVRYDIRAAETPDIGTTAK